MVPGYKEIQFYICKGWWFDCVLWDTCDWSRCGAWQEILRGRSLPPCRRLLLRRKGCCDFAFSAYISTHLRMQFTLGQSNTHTEHSLLHNGTACPFSHLVLSLSPPPSFFIPWPVTSFYFLFCSTFAITNVTVADNSLWCIYRVPTY